MGTPDILVTSARVMAPPPPIAFRSLAEKIQTAMRIIWVLTIPAVCAFSPRLVLRKLSDEIKPLRFKGREEVVHTNADEKLFSVSALKLSAAPGDDGGYGQSYPQQRGISMAQTAFANVPQARKPSSYSNAAPLRVPTRRTSIEPSIPQARRQAAASSTGFSIADNESSWQKDIPSSTGGYQMTGTGSTGSSTVATQQRPGLGTQQPRQQASYSAAQSILDRQRELQRVYSSEPSIRKTNNAPREVAAKQTPSRGVAAAQNVAPERFSSLLSRQRELQKAYETQKVPPKVVVEPATAVDGESSPASEGTMQQTSAQVVTESETESVAESLPQSDPPMLDNDEAAMGLGDETVDIVPEDTMKPDLTLNQPETGSEKTPLQDVVSPDNKGMKEENTKVESTLQLDNEPKLAQDSDQGAQTVEDGAQEQQPAPTGLPVGWAEYIDPVSGWPYYHNAATSVTTWERPENTPVASTETDSITGDQNNFAGVELQPAEENKIIVKEMVSSDLSIADTPETNTAQDASNLPRAVGEIDPKSVEVAERPGVDSEFPPVHDSPSEGVEAVFGTDQKVVDYLSDTVPDQTIGEEVTVSHTDLDQAVEAVGMAGGEATDSTSVRDPASGDGNIRQEAAFEHPTFLGQAIEAGEIREVEVTDGPDILVQAIEAGGMLGGEATDPPSVLDQVTNAGGMTGGEATDPPSVLDQVINASGMTGGEATDPPSVLDQTNDDRDIAKVAGGVAELKGYSDASLDISIPEGTGDTVVDLAEDSTPEVASMKNSMDTSVEGQYEALAGEVDVERPVAYRSAAQSENSLSSGFVDSHFISAVFPGEAELATKKNGFTVTTKPPLGTPDISINDESEASVSMEVKTEKVDVEESALVDETLTDGIATSVPFFATENRQQEDEQKIDDSNISARSDMVAITKTQVDVLGDKTTRIEGAVLSVAILSLVMGRSIEFAMLASLVAAYLCATPDLTSDVIRLVGGKVVNWLQDATKEIIQVASSLEEKLDEIQTAQLPARYAVRASDDEKETGVRNDQENASESAMSGDVQTLETPALHAAELDGENETGVPNGHDDKDMASELVASGNEKTITVATIDTVKISPRNGKLLESRPLKPLTGPYALSDAQYEQARDDNGSILQSDAVSSDALGLKSVTVATMAAVVLSPRYDEHAESADMAFDGENLPGGMDDDKMVSSYLLQLEELEKRLQGQEEESPTPTA